MKLVNKSGNYIVGFCKHGQVITDIRCKHDSRRACDFSEESAQRLLEQYPMKFKIADENTNVESEISF